MSNSTCLRARFGPRMVVAPLAIAGLLSACSLPEAAQRGHQRVSDMWIADNKQVLVREGTRTIHASSAASIAAAATALERIGLTVTDKDLGAGSVIGQRPMSSSDISPAVNAAELPRVRRIMVEEIGPLGEIASFQQPSGTLQATVLIQGKATRSVVTFKLCNNVLALEQVADCTIPTAQYRAGLNEFWNAFDQELPDAKAADAARPAPVQAPARKSAEASMLSADPKPTVNLKPRPVVQPSDWVLPE